MYRVVFFGTHPKQFNGYSRVVYELIQQFAHISDVEFTVFGFQNFYHNEKHRNDLPPNVEIFDAFAHDKTNAGFGISQVVPFVRAKKPDVCIIFNDAVVIRAVVTELLKIPTEERTFKIVPYLDQVYLCQRKAFIDFINQHADACILFTDYWKEVFKFQGATMPTFSLPHGFDSARMRQLPKAEARRALNIPENDFIILNLNRNQPRKRWDTCLKAFARVVAECPQAPIKLLIGTDIIGAWHLLELYERELKKCGLSFEEGKKHLMVIDAPQRLSDDDISVIYNVADVGINTCDGEGFGLCNFDQAGLGIPQIVTNVGGFKDYFEDGVNSITIEPVVSIYVDSGRDGVGGEALIASHRDFVDAMIFYYQSPETRLKHGQAARQKLLTDYRWEDVAQRLRKIIIEVVGEKAPLPRTERVTGGSSFLRKLLESKSCAAETVADTPYGKECKIRQNELTL